MRFTAVLGFVSLAVLANASVIPASVDASVSQPNGVEGVTEGTHVDTLVGDEILEKRAGWTCAWGGNKACQVKCVGMGKSGGYCSKTNVCTCHRG
ncbi:hypothetical protein EC973_002132 [Apophysomyces ossiformis]|uniref:Invertebrate defensins family profile domain-containing protein n=1 Tax=Apophysomyces ossiformis TaxID=679940 RepID=A0A8H7BH19_9FUNG|nr:hypothetical protein EC973_002132 [Apophysomyces ossiformis]